LAVIPQSFPFSWSLLHCRHPSPNSRDQRFLGTLEARCNPIWMPLLFNFCLHPAAQLDRKARIDAYPPPPLASPLFILTPNWPAASIGIESCIFPFRLSGRGLASCCFSFTDSPACSFPLFSLPRCLRGATLSYPIQPPNTMSKASPPLPRHFSTLFSAGESF